MISSVNNQLVEFKGLSTDAKPIDNILNGSVFFEMDTEKVFMFNEEDKVWIELE